MISLTSTGTELRRFRRGALPKLALGALVLIPLLYGALYLWAFWDPMGRMDNLPVALVVEDAGATVDGERLDAGAQIADRLTDSGDLRWERTDAAAAQAGVESGDYYFAVTIPADFSQSIADVAGDAPEAASIAVTYNDANSFLATTLGRSAMEQVQTAVREEIGSQAVDTVLVGLGAARDGFATASDGAIRLGTAAGKVDDGAQQLADGAQSAADGAGSLASGLGELRDGAGSAAAGVTKLDKGAQSLSAGSTTLAQGATSLATGVGDAHEGATSLAQGADKLAEGAAALSQGADTLASGFTADGGLVAGAAQVADGADTLADGLEAAAPTLTALPGTLSDLGQLLQANVATLKALDPTGENPAVQGLLAKDTAALTQLGNVDGAALTKQLETAVSGARTLADGAATLSDGVGTASDGAQALAAQLRPGTKGTTTLRDGITQVSAGATSLEKGLARLDSGASDLASGASSLTSGASELAAGTTTLKSGTSTLLAGTQSAADGASALADGTTTLASGASALADGTTQLADGAGTLASGLVDGTEQIPDDPESLRTQRADVIAAPVVVTDTDVAQAEGFGEGFAPFFISLALFVGALITWLLLRPVPTRALAAPVSGGRIAWAGLWPALLIGAGQVVVMLGVVKLGLGMHTDNLVGLVAFAMLVSATFIALQQAIIALAGPAAGKVVVLAILMLQLASSGGTYPVPVTADFFQAIHPWLPMSYAVTGLRQLITGGADGRLLLSVAVLGGTLVVSLAVTAWRSGRMRTWTVDRLHPAISL